MTTEQLQKVIAQAVSLGMTLQWNMIRPEDDKLKQREAWRLLERQGFSRTDLMDWVKAGYVRRYKKDTKKAANAAVWYSMRDIQKHIITIRTAEMLLWN